jgi:hypothetical protein
VADLDLNGAPGTARAEDPSTPVAGASNGVYPLGVLIVVLAGSPAKNTSPSFVLELVSVPPVTVVPDGALTPAQPCAAAVP